jgi:hypothetical protein
VSVGVPALQCLGAGENVGRDVDFDDSRHIFVIGIDEDDLEEDFGLELRRKGRERHCVGFGVSARWVGGRSGWLVAGIEEDGRGGLLIDGEWSPNPRPNSPSTSLDTYCHWLDTCKRPTTRLTTNGFHEQLDCQLGGR